MKRKIFSILVAFALVLVISLGLVMAVPASAAGSAIFLPTSGPAGTLVTVSGTGWMDSETISSVTVGGLTATFSLAVDASGVLSGTITVPSVTVGAKDIVITGSSSDAQTFAGAFTVTGSATFSPTSGPVGTSLAVSGTGWMDSETISSVTVGGLTATFSLAVDASGVLSGTITVPSVVGGVKDIVITGSSSDAQTFASAFTVTGSATFSSISGPVSTSLAVSGTGWADSETISSVTVGGVAAGFSLTVNSGGVLSGTITIPSVAGGAKNIVITGASSGAQTFASAFTVTGSAIFLPTSGPAGTLVTVSGTGWMDSETISSVTVGGTTATFSLTVDSVGNLSGTATVPSVTVGAKDIVITGSSSGAQTFAGAFTVTIATASLSPASGSIRASLVVSGTGWVGSDTISSVTVGGVAAGFSLTVDASGVLSGTVTVPSVTVGAKDIVITGSSSGAQTFAGAFMVVNYWPIVGAIAAVIVLIVMIVYLVRRGARPRARSV